MSLSLISVLDGVGSIPVHDIFSVQLVPKGCSRNRHCSMREGVETDETMDHCNTFTKEAKLPE